MAVREADQLFVEGGEQVVPPGRAAVGGAERRPVGGRAVAAAGGGAGPAGDPEQPARHPVRVAQRGGPAGEDEEGGLERVVGEVRVAGRPPAHAEDHRPVAADDLGERRRVRVQGEPVYERGVGVWRGGPGAACEREQSGHRVPLLTRLLPPRPSGAQEFGRGRQPGVGGLPADPRGRRRGVPASDSEPQFRATRSRRAGVTTDGARPPPRRPGGSSG